MVKKLNPDFAVCGPCFNFPDYAEMAAKTAAMIVEKILLQPVLSVETTVDTFVSLPTKTVFLRILYMYHKKLAAVSMYSNPMGAQQSSWNPEDL